MESVDKIFLQKTLVLAQKGYGWTNPNPLVGCVIVKNGKIIAKGYHTKAGNAHAEIEALSTAKEDVKGATLYVNVEPCSHTGKTPPCVEAIIKSGIKRVVYATDDPNPKVKGKSTTLFKKAGIAVTSGILQKGAYLLNEAFFTFHEKNRPFIALKFAASLDGKIATKTGDSKWITNEKARRYGHLLRSQYQAILVGIQTILQDDPHLGAQIKGAKDPIRIVLDSTLKIPLTSHVLRDTNVIIATTAKANQAKKKVLQQKNITVLECGDHKISLHTLLAELTKREIISILVEGGGSVHGSFVDARLVDKVYAFYAPIIIGGQHATTAVAGTGVETVTQSLHLTHLTRKQFDDCSLTIGYPQT